MSKTQRPLSRSRQTPLMHFKCTQIFQNDVLWNQLYRRLLPGTSSGIPNALKLLKEKITMTSENNSPDTQKQQDDSTLPETAERKRISRLATEFAKRAKERQLRYDEGHNIFTK
jgi:hypothetical protein